MRTSALLALLPLLANLAAARPHNTEHDHSLHQVHHVRKSLSFGPAHIHASFEVVDEPLAVHGLHRRDVNVKEVAKKFIREKMGSEDGVGFYIRGDTYTNAHTGITHVYARQLLNGLEVSDGDINLNVDRDGRVLSWGNSFHPGPAPDMNGLTKGSSGETERVCAALKETFALHEAELAAKGDPGPWGLVKAAVRVVLGGSAEQPKVDEHEISQIYQNMRHISHHIDAVCDEETSVDDKFLSPVEALLRLLPRISPQQPNMRAEVNVNNFQLSAQHSLVPKEAPFEPPTQLISGDGLAKHGVLNEVPARLMYTQTTEGDPRVVWKLEVKMKDNWYEAYIDSTSGELLRIVDWASDFSWGSSAENDAQLHAPKGGKQKPLPKPSKKLEPYTYQVFPWGTNDPSMGSLSLVTKPWDNVASPLGWHIFPTSAIPWTAKLPGMNVTSDYTTFFTTAGNNVIAQEDWEGKSNYMLNYRPVNESMTFVYDYGEPEGLGPKEYVDMVITQLFYTSNVYHDLLHRLGFDEVSGNFQVSNHGLGGKGGDPLIANGQDGSGYNNANMMTPPDGTPPQMRMYIWDTSTPYRDGDLEAGIVIHEYSHGLSTRLTGGPANSGCLSFGEAGGAGEGWGDALATLIRQIEERKLFGNATDIYSMGAWAANRDAGIRNFRYSTNSTVNPSTYKTLDKPGYWGVHAIGEVWAEMLFVVTQRLVEEHGFSVTLFPPLNTSIPNNYYTKTFEESVDHLGRPMPLVPKHGNTLAIQLIVDGMKLQPCRPSFFDMRDAVIQADQIRTGGANGCLIWKAFAERGLGMDAKVVGQTPWGGGIRTDGHKIPIKVC